VFLRSKESPESAVTNVIAFRRRVPMSTDVTTDVTEGFLVEMDGKTHSEHAHFAGALSTALLLRNENTGASIKVRDLSHRNLEETEGSAAA
jgi:hypothetical protein